HSRADRQPAFGTGSVVDDLGAVLVAHHDVGTGIVVGQAGVVVGVAPRMIHEVQIGRADAARKRSYQQLSVAGHRVGDVSTLHDSVPQHRSAHLDPPPTFVPGANRRLAPGTFAEA